MEKRQTETSTGENLVSSVEEALKLRGEGPVIETLKLNGMDHDKACRFVERVMLIKSGYYSLPSEIKRFFGVLDTRNADNLFTILYKHLLYVGLYGSQEEINTKVSEMQKSMEEFESKHGYRDDLYYYSSCTKRKIVILNNLHYGDFSSSLQNKVIAFLGKENISKSVSDRSRHIQKMAENLASYGHLSELTNESET